MTPFNYKPGFSAGINDRVKSTYFSGGAFSGNQTIQYSVPQRPIATATNPTTGQTIIAYMRQAAKFTTDTETVCWVMSSDAGQSNFSAETCDSQFDSIRYGVSAAYDPRSNVFILAIATDDGTLYFDTIPATGSSTPASHSAVSQHSFAPPSIACKNTSYGCRIAFEDATIDGCLKWMEAQVNTTNGTIDAPTTRSQCFYLYDTPSIAYFQSDDTFRLAFQQGNGAAYAEYMSSTGTSWTGMPDIWNSSGSEITSPVLSTEAFCFFGCTYALRAWYIRTL